MKVFFIIFVAAYAAFIVISPNLGPADDYLFLRTIQSGRPLLYYTNPPPGFPVGDLTKFGRFNFLGTAEYNFFNFFSDSPSPFRYYLSHAFQYVVLMFLFVKILSRFTPLENANLLSEDDKNGKPQSLTRNKIKKHIFLTGFTDNKLLIYLIPILFSFTTTIPWFRTQIADRNLILYYAIFIFFYLKYLEKPKLYYLILGIISATMAIHYKENGFIALSAFAFSHLVLSWRNSKLALKISDVLVLLSSFAYLVLYYFVVYRNLTPNHALWNATVFNPSLVFIKNIANYALFSDPVLVLILLPFTGWRIYGFLRRRLELHPVYDSMLIAASTFVLGYFVLNIYSPNYFLPAYIFALPPLIYFFSRAEKITLFWKGAAAVCGLALILNTFPTGIHNLTYQKYLPTNFNKTLNFLIEDINARYPNKRANIFIDAVNPSTGGGVYFIIGEFLQYKGLTWNRFDLRSDVKMNDAVIKNVPDVQKYAPFSVFQDKLSEISRDDYLIITADGSTTKNITSDYIRSLNKDYDLIFRTNSPLAFPNLNLKTLAKYFLSGALSQSQKTKEGKMLNENLMQSPDYYVFIRK